MTKNNVLDSNRGKKDHQYFNTGRSSAPKLTDSNFYNTSSTKVNDSLLKPNRPLHLNLDKNKITPPDTLYANEQG